MAVSEKKRYVIYLDEENAEYVKDFLQTSKHKGGFSGLIDTYVTTLARTLKSANYVKGQDKVSAKQMWKIGLKGLREST